MAEYAGLLAAGLQLLGFIIGGVVIASSMRTTLRHLDSEVQGLKKEMKGIGETLLVVAVQTNRLDTVDKRLDGHDRLIDDLRRGEGFIMPLVRPPGS